MINFNMVNFNMVNLKCCITRLQIHSIACNECLICPILKGPKDNTRNEEHVLGGVAAGTECSGMRTKGRKGLKPRNHS